MIPQTFIDDLLQRVDIIEVVNRYVPLKKSGQNFSACCPFHNEKSPSFTVSPTKQFYHCFGCGAHGSALTFLMEHTQSGFVDAVETLAAQVGMTVPTEARHNSETETRRPTHDALELMQAATRYYRDQLKLNPRAIDYLKNRGLSGQIAARFGIGYSPDGWQNLEAIAADYQTSKSLLESGLVIQNDQGRRYDRFRDRIMFPIINTKGQMIGFGGRVLDKGEPKYLNSPETVLFEKGKELYGLYQARNAIRDKGRVLVVEGYMDVVALAQFGIEYAVATLGTATTPQHLQKLMRQTDHIYFCFDGDSAGRRAAWRALENALPMLNDSVTCDFVFLPEEHDPDSYIREFGTEGFEAYLEKTRLPLSVMLMHELTRRVDMNSAEGRARLVHETKPYFNQLQQAPALAALLRKRLTELSGLDSQDISQLIGVAPKAKPKTLERRTRTVSSLAQRMLSLLIAKPALASLIPNGFDLLLAQQGEEDALRTALEILAHRPQLKHSAVFLQALEEELPSPLILACLRDQELLPNDDELEAEMAGAVVQMQKMLGNREVDALKLKEQTQNLTPEEKNRLLQIISQRHIL